MDVGMWGAQNIKRQVGGFQRRLIPGLNRSIRHADIDPCIQALETKTIKKFNKKTLCTDLKHQYFTHNECQHFLQWHVGHTEDEFLS